jgi:hypothetical protein
VIPNALIASSIAYSASGAATYPSFAVKRTRGRESRGDQRPGVQPNNTLHR